MTPTHQRTSRLPSLTGMRFIAALMVFAFHVAWERFFRDPEVQGDYADVVNKAGWIGVSFFFVLSGFVLAWSRREGERAPGFWRRRIAKVYPGHLVTALVAFWLISRTDGMLAAAGTVDADEAITNLSLIHSWWPEYDVFLSGNAVSWSLACELFFYLAFPVLWMGVSRIRASHLWPAAVVVTAAIICVPLVAKLVTEDPVMMLPDGTASLKQYWCVYIFPPVRALEFVLGMLLARVVAEGRWFRMPLVVPIALFGVGYYLAAREVPYLYSLVAATIIPIALLIPAAADADIRGGGSWFASRPMVWLGERSFAFYLVHLLVLLYGHDWLGRGKNWETGQAVLVIIGFLLVSLALSAVLYEVVEKPGMRYLSGSRSTRPAPGSGGAARAAGVVPGTPEPSASAAATPDSAERARTERPSGDSDERVPSKT
ncbi:acyltransferase [Streptomyces sp. 71268]|uniref:acyltransferase family protein n=1 Tax=Streptomyces sp. 71268 TaxID=3002640 RepID=UPI0023F7063A|nr:acyltransferase [Streptomyces sp. 71268]WEV28006.1 acyltransferase [Streptomyces sp. 71268]